MSFQNIDFKIFYQHFTKDFTYIGNNKNKIIQKNKFFFSRTDFLNAHTDLCNSTLHNILYQINLLIINLRQYTKRSFIQSYVPHIKQMFISNTMNKLFFKKAKKFII